MLNLLNLAPSTATCNVIRHRQKEKVTSSPAGERTKKRCILQQGCGFSGLAQPIKRHVPPKNDVESEGVKNVENLAPCGRGRGVSPG